MAALGAAAGAFQGDMEREAAAARRAQLGLQAQRMNQDAQQFNISMRARQADKERAQANSDRTFALQERTAKLTEKKNEWEEALKNQQMEAKKLEFKMLQEEYGEFQRIRKQAEDARNERTRLADSVLGHIARSAIENGQVSPEELDLAYRKTGIRLKAAYADGNGGVIANMEAGKDAQGQPLFRDRYIDPTIIASVMERYHGQPFEGGRSSGGWRGSRGSGVQQQAQTGAVELSKAGERLLNIRLGRIERERSDILKKLAQDDAKEMLGDKEYQKLKDRLMQLDKDEDAAVYSAYGETTPAPSGAQGGGAGIGYTEQQINELGGLKAQALREANGDEAKALDIFKQKKKQWESSGRSVLIEDNTEGSNNKSKRQVDPNLKALAQKALADAGGDKEKAAQLYAQYRTGISKQESVEQPVVDAEPYRSRFGPRLGNVNVGSKAASFGPEPGTTEYWRDMPRGQATGMSKREIGFARRDILKRLEAAYRKGPKGRDEAAQIKAELDAFNEQYRP